jgi:hypothetical protein
MALARAINADRNHDAGLEPRRIAIDRSFAPNPIIRPHMLPAGDGDNINGPSVIRAPAWLPERLGNYYLYFAHHNGSYIRLATADRIEGPWKVHPGGTLRLSDASACRGHIASPDVHVDDERREIRMYFHAPARAAGGQWSFVAVSANGIDFTASDALLGPPYFRVTRFREGWIAFAKGGQIFLSGDGRRDFRPALRQAFPMRHPNGDAPGDIRHVALKPRDGGFDVYFTRIGDAPERILRAHVTADDSGQSWRSGLIEEVIAPSTAWEGVNIPIAASRFGASRQPEHALRDPALLTDGGRDYLFYSVAGESGIAVALLKAGD